MSEAREFQKSKGKGKGKPTPKSTKLRGLEKDNPETRVSKTITWLLRHGAANEGLAIREDGYVLVDELVSLILSSSSRVTTAKLCADQQYDDLRNSSPIPNSKGWA
jgi:2'-phosphotransferase